MTIKASPRLSFGGYSALILLLLLLANNGAYAASPKVTDAEDKEMEAKYNQYGLPYGVLGAISHLLTYWVILCHYYGRRPLQPWRVLKKKGVNMYIVVISSIVSITVVVITMLRAHETLPLVVLAALQVVLNVVVDALNAHRLLCRKQDGLIRGTILWGAILYAVSYASIYAMAKMSKSNRLDNKWDIIAIILVVLACGSGAIAFIAFIAWVRAGYSAEGTTLHVLAVAGLLCSCAYFLCGDYAVAVLTGNTIGVPSEKVAKLYWVFWAFERIPLFTF